MRLREFTTPSGFWDDRRHRLDPALAAQFDDLFVGKTFPSEAAARAFILQTLRRKHASALLPADGGNEAAIAAAAPVYYDGTVYRIGTEAVQPKITWKELRVGSESRYDIAVSADASAEEWECDFKVHWVRCEDILPARADDSYMNDPVERDRIARLAATIVENGYVTPIFVGEGEDENESIDRWVIEGQHRTRAVFYHLGLPTIPGYVIEIFD